jgi:hypothetical protein
MFVFTLVFFLELLVQTILMFYSRTQNQTGHFSVGGAGGAAPRGGGGGGAGGGAGVGSLLEQRGDLSMPPIHNSVTQLPGL